MSDQPTNPEGKGASQAPSWLKDALDPARTQPAAPAAAPGPDAYDPLAGGEFVVVGEAEGAIPAPSPDPTATHPGMTPKLVLPPPPPPPPPPPAPVMRSEAPVGVPAAVGEQVFHADEPAPGQVAPEPFVPPADAGREPEPAPSVQATPSTARPKQGAAHAGAAENWDGPEGAVSRADMETLADDPTFQKFAYRLSETSMFAVKIARLAWVVAAIGWLGFFVSTGFLYKFVTGMMEFRFPYVRSDATGDVQLVQAVPEIATAGEFPDAVVLSTVGQFYQTYFGISDYHQRELWPKLKLYYLTAPQGEQFARFAQDRMKEAQKDNILRRVSIRSRIIDEKNVVKAKGGGIRYLARVEFVEEDIDKETQMVKRKRLYQSKLIFTLGATFAEITPDAKKLLAIHNPLNLQIVEMTTPDPIFLDINTNRPLDAPAGGGETPSSPTPAKPEAE